MQRTLTLKTCKRTEEYYDRGIVDVSEARHLFRVAAGLESPLLGETAILGEIKKSYDEARREDKLSANINRLFQQAIHVGHRVRVETGISRGAVSYSQVTVDILCKELADLGNKVVSIIGVNELTDTWSFCFVGFNKNSFLPMLSELRIRIVVPKILFL